MTDANGTRFHLVFGRDDWLAAGEGDAATLTEDVQWFPDDATLRLTSRPFRHSTGGEARGADKRRGADRDMYGNWYWIGPDEDELLCRGTAMGRPHHFWSSADEIPRLEHRGVFQPTGTRVHGCEPVTLRGLAVTTHHYLVAGLVKPKGLLVFDLHAGGPPTWIAWHDTFEFEPFDITAALDGGVRILDRAHRICWRMNRYFQLSAHPSPGPAGTSPDAATFKPEASAASMQQSDPVSLPQRPTEPLLRLDAMTNPVAVVELPDGSVLVLDSDAALGHSVLHRYALEEDPHGARHWQLRVRHELDDLFVDTRTGTPFSLLGQDMAFVSDDALTTGAVAGTLHVAGASGGQAFAFRLDDRSRNKPELTKPFEFQPLRRFGGKALVTAGNRPYYDSADRWVPLAEQPRPKYETEAVHLLRPRVRAAVGGDTRRKHLFDGKLPGCVWHRLLLDACIPPGTAVLVESRAADRPPDLDEMDWQTEPALYLRHTSSELPYYRSQIAGPTDRAGTWELLFQRARGQYLELRLTLKGTGRATPRLHALRVYYPRFSYSNEYLPAVYREEPESASFLERYLANPEGTLTALEDKIATAQVLFDPDSAPAESLDWLAGWLGASLDPSWKEPMRRMFIAEAPEIFRRRGTLQGVEQALRLAFDPHPEQVLRPTTDPANRASAATGPTPGFHVRVVEQFLLRRAPGVVFGDPSDVQGPGVSTSLSEWSPEQGAQPLHKQFHDYLVRRYSDPGRQRPLKSVWGQHLGESEELPDPLRLPAVQPDEDEQAEDWERFLDESLGFLYPPVADPDLPRFAAFLRRRYRQAQPLNQAYGLTKPAALTALTETEVRDKVWDAILRNTLPPGGNMLLDWIQFVSLVLPTQDNAHRFSVLVPVTPSDPHSKRAEKLRLAKRITDLVKPAHTSFAVKFFWAMFRVGEARVGLETIPSESGRSEDTVLGDTYLGEGHLAVTPPWNADERFVVGRESTHRPTSDGPSPGSST